MTVFAVLSPVMVDHPARAPVPEAPAWGVTIYATDVARLADFYAAVLGWPRAEETEGYVVLAGDGGEISIVRMTPAEEAPSAGVWPRRAGTPIRPVLVVRDLESALAAARAAGGRPDGPDARWEFRGLVRHDVVDPEGNVVQVAQSG